MARSHCWPGLVLVLQCAVRTVDHERTNQVGGTSFPSASQWHSFVLTLRQTMWREFGVEHHPSGSAVLCSVFKVAVNDSLYHSSSSPWRTKDCWSRLQLNELVDNFCTLYHSVLVNRGMMMSVALYSYIQSTMNIIILRPNIFQ